VLALAALEMSAIPVWLLDGERMRIVWANQRAVELWRATSREDLLARDLSGAPVSVRVRTAALLERVRAGEAVIEEWTLYPKGVPTPVRLHLSGVSLEDGRIGLLNQALPIEEAARTDPTTLRGIEAIRHVSVIVALVADDFVHFSIAGLLVPFASSYRATAVAWGVVAFWLLVAVEVSSLAMSRLPRKAWYYIHLTSYVVAVAATLHALYTGTDTANPVFRWAGLTALGLVGFFAIYRVIAPAEPRGRNPTGAKTGRYAAHLQVQGPQPPDW